MAAPVVVEIQGEALNTMGFVAELTIEGVALNTFGFLWPSEGIWEPCDPIVTTTWTDC